VPGLMQTDAATGKSAAKSLKTLLTESMAHAQKTVPNGNKEAMLKAAKAYLMPKLAGKSNLYLLPTLFGMTVTGALVAVMNQFWTKYRFKAIQQTEHQFLNRYKSANPNRLQRPFSLNGPIGS
jgi:hypothetical protein